MWIFDRNDEYGGIKPHLFLPWKRNINYRIKCVVELFSEIQELTAEPLYYIDKFTFYLYNYPVMV